MTPQEITIPSGNLPLHASLILPPRARGLIALPQAGGIFPGCRHEFAAHIQEEGGFATLLINLLSFRDSRHGDIYGNVPLLTQRILDSLAWIAQQIYLEDLPLGLLAAGTTAPAALRASAQRDQQVLALVCRGGLPDQAGTIYLESLVAPSLFIFGADDPAGQASGQRSLDKMNAPGGLETIPGSDREFTAAPHFDAAARAARRWFQEKLPARNHKNQEQATQQDG